MVKGKPNSWGDAQADSYIKTADIVVVERKRLLKILIDIFRYYFESKEKLVLLDLGCGDGVLSKRIASNYPKNEFHLMDGSAAMLEKAKQNFSGANVHYRHQSFEDYISSPANDGLYDFVYSANAIHHLDFLSKSQIYAKIFSELKFGGLFLNFDPVLPTSERSEQWQFNMWTDWIKEYLQKNGIEEDLLLKSLNVAEIDAIPTNYKMKSENKPSNLFDTSPRRPFHSLSEHSGRPETPLRQGWNVIPVSYLLQVKFEA